MCMSSNRALETDSLVGKGNRCYLALEQIIQLRIEEWLEWPDLIDINFILWKGMWPERLCYNWEDEFNKEFETKDLELDKDENIEKLYERVCLRWLWSKIYESLTLSARTPREKLFFNEGSCRRQSSSVKIAKILSWDVNLERNKVILEF